MSIFFSQIANVGLPLSNGSNLRAKIEQLNLRGQNWTMWNLRTIIEQLKFVLAKFHLDLFFIVQRLFYALPTLIEQSLIDINAMLNSFYEISSRILAS